MTTRIGVFVAVVLTGLSPLCAAGEGGPSVEDYSVLWERSIFSRDRGYRPPEPASVVRERREAYRPERDYVLTGIVQRGEECVAFLEDLRTGETTWAGAGEEIAGGTIKSITLDQVKFEIDGDVKRVKPGDDLAGRAPAPAVEYGSLPEAPTAEGAGAEEVNGGAEGGDATDILEQLKRRREEELK